MTARGWGVAAACLAALALAVAWSWSGRASARLTAESLAKARPGMVEEELVALLGPPRDVTALWDGGRLSELRRGLGAALDLPGRKISALLVERPVRLLEWRSGEDEALAFLEHGALRAIAWRVKGQTQARTARE